MRDAEQMRHGVRALLSELVYTHWLAFFESPLIDPEASPAHILSLARRVQLDRNARRFDLATVAAGGAGAIADGFRAIQQVGDNNAKKPLGPGEKDENSRGLDRISYLVVILLPFTVVPSVLSMSDAFGTTGGIFWVFWVVCAPLTVLALLFYLCRFHP